MFGDAIYHPSELMSFKFEGLEEAAVRLYAAYLKRCGEDWRASELAAVGAGGRETLPEEKIREFEAFHREASNSIRRLGRKSMILRSATRLF